MEIKKTGATAAPAVTNWRKYWPVCLQRLSAIPTGMLAPLRIVKEPSDSQRAALPFPFCACESQQLFCLLLCNRAGKVPGFALAATCEGLRRACLTVKELLRQRYSNANTNISKQYRYM